MCVPKFALLLLVLAVLGKKTFSQDVIHPDSFWNYTSVGFQNKTLFRCLGIGIGLFTQTLSSQRWTARCGTFHRRRLTLLYLTALLLLNSYSPEPNPGPTPTSLNQSGDHYPCGNCDASVTYEDKGVECETCGLWFHAQCQSIDAQSYENLKDANAHWYCAICGNPNSLTAYDLHGVDWPSTSPADDCLSFSFCSMPSESNFHPQHCSTPTRSNQQNKWKNRPLRILNINFRSADGKKSSMPLLLDTLKPDIIIGTETWLDSNIFDREILPDFYQLYRKDRSRHGGGVLLAVRSNLKSYAVPELDTDCEMVWAAVKLQGTKKLYVCAYYRPDVSDAASLVKFEESLDRAAGMPNAHLLIGGDLNFPGWDWPTLTLKSKSPEPTLHRKFLSLLQDHGLEQMVMEPTREDNILDLFITNNPHLVPRVEVAPGLSDHRVVYCEYTVTAQKIKQAERNIFLYDKADWDSIRARMVELLPTMERDQDDLSTEELWKSFKDTLQLAVEKAVPQKVARTKTSKPWVTSDIRKLVLRRNRLYKKMKRDGSELLKVECRHLRREIQRKLRRSYWKYINETLTSEDEDGSPSLKRFWSYIKHQRTAKIGVSPLRVDGCLVTEPKAQAEALNNQFQSVFSRGQAYNSTQFMDKCRMDTEGSYSELSDVTITLEGVRTALLNLNPHKACGPDGISPRVLKELAVEISPILKIVFESSLSTGIVPRDWRDANVTPIFKKGEHYDPSNYRPVSLTSVPCKIMEHIIVKSLMNHLDSNKILCTQQHGFRKERSCETQLLEFVEELNLHMAEGKETDVIIMDFAKAFDKVNHSLLLHKLHHYGVKGRVNRWIQGFLGDRRQAVVVNGARSDHVSVRSGVPQGSVLGPSLFLVYINDLPEKLSSRSRLFADDTAVYRLLTTAQDQPQLQRDLRVLEEWEDSWDMQFHPGKCNTLPISRQRDKTVAYHYKLHGQILETVNSVKYLGVTMNQDLSWDNHIDNICNKANRTLGFLRRNLRIGATHLKETAYKTFVRPIIEYASSVWDPYTQGNIDKLEMVQRRAARFVCNRYRRTASVTEMIESLGWSTLQERRKVARLSMFFKLRQDLVKVDKSSLKAKPSRRRRGQQHRKQYVEDITHTQDYRLGSFFPKTVKDWNKLSQTAVDANTPDTFVSRVRKELL